MAGSEAAYQLAKRGIKVKLYEMKPIKYTEVHKSENFAELVCSNSLGSNLLTSASGLMKEELRYFDSFLIDIADKVKVPAGQALAVDREGFSEMVTKKIQENENIEIINEELLEIPKDKYVIIASGPLTSEGLSKKITELVGDDYLYFYDAVAPILTYESLNQEKVYFASRYDKGEGEYINCPMSKEEYTLFYNELINAETIPLKKHEKEKLFEACMPVERIASRGEKTLLFGPLKPKGLTNPRTGEEDYAVVQLRQDDKNGELYNMVGFQTNLKWGEQKRVFSLIPGLENADFIRYGVMHRNTFINSTKLLNKDLSLKSNDKIFFSGQITGSEGYVSAIATGLLAAINLYNKMNEKEVIVLPTITAMGAIVNYITEERKKFQPMGPNFGIIEKLDERIKDKRERYKAVSERSINYLNEVFKKDFK
ncbi:methylenetetrahydrofolate--tRNA-(uracil-5-)-methyltransferase TrmFO [Haliovirga abyssi]|uniref:Methylenetetrahydrofolate--tRNA-(uracil-5-)-methyltransferase TrmFO n=1 Tax=Haliovirga abyssi TaxID=2996794 RepID=A0AAU9DBZ9_9FUSO|nr:methylenetetrahydrofolate--tRNA-(uracil-5-)-methyltransferase TrmFO [Haliovirga abyssi]